MGPKLNAMEVFKRTPRSNCGECGLANCMAFSALVIQGQKAPGDCPYLDADFVGQISGHMSEPEPEQEDQGQTILEELLVKVPDVDFFAAAKRLGGELKDGRLAIRCLGKIFEIDGRGGLHSECHANIWIHVSLLQYVVHGRGRELTGEWTTFRELTGSKDWVRFFNHRCEAAFLEMADEHTDLFLDILDLFGREPDTGAPSADHSVLLFPLPKVPFLFCYWPPEGSFESRLSLFFDRSIEDNLAAQGTYLLGQGIVEMFKKIISKHSVSGFPGVSA